MSAASGFDWREVDTPLGDALNDVVPTANGPVAVGASGRVLHRAGDAWRITAEDGPAGRSKTLYAADPTEDGERVWLCGDSGALGRYDVPGDDLKDRSAPDGRTSTWRAIAATGPTNSETVHVANTSGTILSGPAGAPTWGDGTADVATVGSGASITTLVARTDTAVCANANGNVFEGADTWKHVGVPDCQSTLTDVAHAENTTYAVADDGHVYTGDGTTWTSAAATGASLNGVETRAGHALAVGGSGTILHRADDTWTELDTPVGNGLNAIAIHDGRAYAVGGSGTILESPLPDTKKKKGTSKNQKNG